MATPSARTVEISQIIGNRINYIYEESRITTIESEGDSLGGLYPSEFLYPESDLYPMGNYPASGRMAIILPESRVLEIVCLPEH